MEFGVHGYPFHNELDEYTFSYWSMALRYIWDIFNYKYMMHDIMRYETLWSTDIGLFKPSSPCIDSHQVSAVADGAPGVRLIT